MQYSLSNHSLFFAFQYFNAFYFVSKIQPDGFHSKTTNIMYCSATYLLVLFNHLVVSA